MALRVNNESHVEHTKINEREKPGVCFGWFLSWLVLGGHQST